MSVEKKKRYTRYLVVKVEFEVDCTRTDQNPDDHVSEIADGLVAELDCSVTFDGELEAGDSCENAIEVPVKIVETEVEAFLMDRPLSET